MKKSLLVSIALVVVIGLVTAVSTQALAIVPTGQHSLIQKLAEKFGLKESEVQMVFDQFHVEKQQDRETKYEDSLTQAVRDGKLTETQKSLLITKHKELIDSREDVRDNWQSMTRQERQEAMKTKKDELDKWAADNGIDKSYLFGGLGMRGRHHMM